MRPTSTRISVLGPLEVTVAGRRVALPAKQRTLLAILALHANRPVAPDRLVEAIWGQDASPGVARTLQSHVFQLRRALAGGTGAHGDRLRIATDHGGYRLEVDPAAIDANAFMGLFQAARADEADARCAATLLTEALAQWRGPRVADVGDEPAAMAEAQQLEELRVSAIEHLARIRIAQGEHEQAVPDLRRAVAEAPYSEQLWASLMLALARSGRRAESLIAYRHAQEALRRELDIEPGRVLQDLALRIRDESIAPAAAHDGGRPAVHATTARGARDARIPVS
jgi:DNA-binding SARP family transcriptional activator